MKMSINKTFNNICILTELFAEKLSLFFIYRHREENVSYLTIMQGFATINWCRPRGIILYLAWHTHASRDVIKFRLCAGNNVFILWPEIRH